MKGLFDLLFGNNEEHNDIEDYRSVSSSDRFRKHGSGNWTNQEDWSCGEESNTGGWDSYEDNDF